MTGWYNDNSLRSYPFTENTLRAATSGEVLDNAVVVDLSIATAAVGDIRVTRVVYGNGIASIAVAAGATDIATAVAYPVVSGRAYPLISLQGRTTGFVVFGVGAQIPDRKVLSFTNLVVEPKAIRRLPAGNVSSIGKNGTTTQLTGYVKLDFGNDFNYSVGVADGVTTITLSLRADTAQKYIGPCSVGDSVSRCPAPPLRSINGVPADSNGTLTLELQ